MKQRVRDVRRGKGEGGVKSRGGVALLSQHRAVQQLLLACLLCAVLLRSTL